MSVVSPNGSGDGEEETKKYGEEEAEEEEEEYDDLIFEDDLEERPSQTRKHLVMKSDERVANDEEHDRYIDIDWPQKDENGAIVNMRITVPVIREHRRIEFRTITRTRPAASGMEDVEEPEELEEEEEAEMEAEEATFKEPNVVPYEVKVVMEIVTKTVKIKAPNENNEIVEMEHEIVEEFIKSEDISKYKVVAIKKVLSDGEEVLEEHITPESSAYYDELLESYESVEELFEEGQFEEEFSIEEEEEMSEEEEDVEEESEIRLSFPEMSDDDDDYVEKDEEGQEEEDRAEVTEEETDEYSEGVSLDESDDEDLRICEEVDDFVDDEELPIEKHWDRLSELEGLEDFIRMEAEEEEEEEEIEEESQEKSEATETLVVKFQPQQHLKKEEEDIDLNLLQEMKSCTSWETVDEDEICDSTEETESDVEIDVQKKEDDADEEADTEPQTEKNVMDFKAFISLKSITLSQAKEELIDEDTETEDERNRYWWRTSGYEFEDSDVPQDPVKANKVLQAKLLREIRKQKQYVKQIENYYRKNKAEICYFPPEMEVNDLSKCYKSELKDLKKIIDTFSDSYDDFNYKMSITMERNKNSDALLNFFLDNLKKVLLEIAKKTDRYGIAKITKGKTFEQMISEIFSLEENLSSAYVQKAIYTLELEELKCLIHGGNVDQSNLNPEEKAVDILLLVDLMKKCNINSDLREEQQFKIKHMKDTYKDIVRNLCFDYHEKKYHKINRDKIVNEIIQHVAQAKEEKNTRINKLKEKVKMERSKNNKKINPMTLKAVECYLDIIKN